MASSRSPGRSWNRRWGPIVGTLGLHGALLALVWRQPELPPLKMTTVSIEGRIGSRFENLPKPIPETVRRSAAIHDTHAIPELRASPSRAPNPFEEPPEPATASRTLAPNHPTALAPNPPAAPPAASSGTINLFPSETLNRLTGGDALPIAAAAKSGAKEAPDQAAAAAREAKERIDGWLSDDMARQRVQSGNVDPVWHEIESGALDRYDPPSDLVRSGKDKMTTGEKAANQAVSMLRQIWMAPHNVEPSPPSRFTPPEPRRGPEDHIYRNDNAFEQTEAVLKAWSKPTNWRHTEVELRVDGTGEVESVRVVSSSGVPKLDELAAKAIESSARSRPAYRDDGKHTVTRWAVECAYAANALNRVGFSFDETGSLNRGRGARGIHKFIDDPQFIVGGKVHRKVKLLSTKYE